MHTTSLLTQNHKNLTKSYRDYLQNTLHVLLRNRRSLSIIATESLLSNQNCRNIDRGVQLLTLAYHVVAPGFEL